MPATLSRPRTVTLQEFTAAPPGKIDRANGVIRGVRILGRVSKNGREYSNRAMQEACKLYEGLEVNINHPSISRAANARPVGETWGVLRNCRGTGDSVRGDLHYLTQHRETPSILERIDKGVPLGLSHNVAGRTTRRGNRTIVESISQVHSVDLVTRPATNRNLFESVGHNATDSTKQRIARLRGNYVAPTLLQEEFDTGGSGTIETHADKLATSIEQILISRSMTNRTKLQQIAKLIGVEPDLIVQEAVAPTYSRPTTTASVMARLR